MNKNIVIKSIKISGSPFFKDVKLEFSDSLNCIMGGRGTGKTTLVEFIKSCIKKNVESDSYSYSLLKNNLGDGSLTLMLENDDGINIKIEKLLGEKPQIYCNDVIKDIDEILSSINLDIYETNMIEKIGREPIDRLNLIDKKQFQKIHSELNKIYNFQLSLDNNANEIKDVRHRIKLKREQLRDYSDIDGQLKEHVKNKPDSLEDAEKKEFENADQKQKTRNSERRILKEIDNIVNRIQQDTKRLEGYLSSKEINESLQNIVNDDLFNGLLDELDNMKSSISSKIEEIIKNVNDYEKSVIEKKELIRKRHNEQEANFIELKKKFDKHSSYLNRYNQLTTKIEKRDLLSAELEKLEKKQSKLWQERQRISSDYYKLKEKIFNIRLDIVNELNEKFDEEVVIQLSFGGIKDKFEELLRQGLRGSGIHYNMLVPDIATAMTPSTFAKAIHENDLSSLKAIRNIDESRSDSIYESFKNSDEIFQIEKLYLPDRPDFLLKVYRDKGSEPYQYKNSEQLSMGQRCTTVLPIIFAVSRNPLIIDQPEDNLDNEYISDTIREIITTQKKSRQLIFVTHNPNIPVLSDAEYNVFFKFLNQSEISNSGTVEEVKNSIIELLEGGRKAFERRKEIYGGFN